MGDNNVEAPPVIASGETNMNVYSIFDVETQPSSEILMKLKLLKEKRTRMEFVYFEATFKKQLLQK